MREGERERILVELIKSSVLTRLHRDVEPHPLLVLHNIQQLIIILYRSHTYAKPLKRACLRSCYELSPIACKPVEHC